MSGGAVWRFVGVCERRAVGCAVVLFGGLRAFVNGCAAGCAAVLSGGLRAFVNGWRWAVRRCCLAVCGRL
ncbi:hypothetical protein [uncultured Ruminococcus sp.]|uniref:hypothetical protein n=1 Tax=uncultured Ruminococcus sp. TaxID=165186 RepID=UPI0025DABE72|nr:hypothetical protein [uncultured Ruminococcus sp.]